MLKAPVWTDPYFDEGAGNTIMTTYARPFFERGGETAASKVKGIVTADVSLEWLTNLVYSVQVAAQDIVLSSLIPVTLSLTPTLN